MIRSDLSRLQIVVLAAGYSIRMGKPKALAKIHGISLIRRTITLLAPFAVNKVIIVTPPRARRMRIELRGLPVRFISNPARARGLSASVIRGLHAARCSGAALLIPVDLAELNVRDIARLASRWSSAKRRVIAHRLGDRASIPLILPRWLYPRAHTLAGDVGLRALLADLPIAASILLQLPSAHRDTDTPQDLRDARRRAHFRSF